MKELLESKEFNVGDYITNIPDGMICSTFPLKQFDDYKNQERNNGITDGIIIDIDNDFMGMTTLLIQGDNNDVVCVRVYD